MRSECVEKLPHSCGSSDALQVYQTDSDGYTAYCFACDTYEPDPYKDKPSDYNPEHVSMKPSPAMIQVELMTISGLPTEEMEDRKLSKETMDYFRIKMGVSEQDGVTPVFCYFPYRVGPSLKAYKTRFLPDKKIWAVGDMKGVDMFGWQQALASGGKRLFITEGEFDAAAVYQALKNRNRGTKWSELDPAVVSLANGAGGAVRDITKHMSSIRQNFKEIVLVFDMDEPGRKATEEVLKIFPGAMAVDLPSKDANEMVMEGRSRSLCDILLFKAEKPKSTRLVYGSSLYEVGRAQAEMGLSWPWKGLTNLTRGLRFGETYYIGAGVKMGKSEVVNTLAAHLITEHQLRVFLAKPEESNGKTYKLVLGKIAGKIFHDPNVEFDYDAYDKAHERVGDNLCVLNLYQNLEWNNLRDDILQAASEGYRAIFIDPITNLTNGVGSGEANTVLQAIAQELSTIAMDQDLMIFIFCHLNNPAHGLPHNRGGHVLSDQFTGSRAMMRSCNMMIGIEGNKDPDLEEEERNVRQMVILEDREFGATGKVPLYWDQKTSLFNEMRSV
tara:strand:- start:1355 stop:3019 length:1665 start_codon:yes stop_codon:yes gene_type:complete